MLERIRKWVCSICQARHDRDVNAAINILHLGHQVLGSEVSLCLLLSAKMQLSWTLVS
ncbi:MAG: transposase [Oligoflexales bacterium]|nr:transposase [Oligoflexales bacterium]